MVRVIFFVVAKPGCKVAPLPLPVALDGHADNTTGKLATPSGLFSLPNQSLRRSPNSNQLC